MGSTAEVETVGGAARRLTTFAHAVLFVLGFSIVFVVGWGGAATLVGRAFGQYKTTLAQVGGAVVILFGLATIGVLKIPWLNYDTRPQWSGQGGFLASGVMGGFFAAGWSPCIGATLGAILTLGFSQDDAAQAMVLAGGYALGLGVPFLALGLAMEKATRLVRRLGPHLRKIQLASGAFLVGIGVLMLTNQLTLIAIWAQRNGLYLDVSQTGGIPAFPIAVVAGLLSFVSPCVLPLVPAYLGYLSGRMVGPRG